MDVNEVIFLKAMVRHPQSLLQPLRRQLPQRLY